MNKSPSSSIPQFGLYGEPGWIDDPEFIHIEDIASRSGPLGWVIGAHRHGQLFQLLCIHDGEVEVHLDDQVFYLKGAWVICIPAGVVHSFKFAKDTRGAIVTLAGPLLLEERGSRAQPYFEPLFSQATCIDFGQEEHFRRQLKLVLQDIKHEFSHALSGRSLMCEWLVRILLMCIFRQHEQNGQAQSNTSAPTQMIRQIKALIEQHYRDHWSVEQYADEMGSTVSRLNRLTGELLGQTVKQMIQERMLLEVKRRLIYTRNNLDQIAYDLGFKDPGYFSRYFKRAEGVPPGQFRKENNFDGLE